jgi:hypothetical protein
MGPADLFCPVSDLFIQDDHDFRSPGRHAGQRPVDTPFLGTRDHAHRDGEPAHGESGAAPSSRYGGAPVFEDSQRKDSSSAIRTLIPLKKEWGTTSVILSDRL